MVTASGPNTGPANLSRLDLIKLSIPLIIGSLLEPLAAVIDNAFVGNLNTQWLAALAFGTMILSSVSWVFNFIIHVSTESISKVFGQGSEKDIIGLTQITLLIATIIGLITSIVLYFGHRPMFDLIGVNQEVFQVTKDYFFIRLLGHPFTVLFVSVISLLRGISEIKTSMTILLVATALNTCLNYLFLYQLRLGPEYAAWGTNISMFVGFLLALFMHLQKVGGRKFLKAKTFSFKDLVNFSSKSLNLFLRSFCLTSMFFISTKIAGSLGIVDLAAHQVLLQFWLFSSFFIDGVAILANIYVSRWCNQNKTSDVRWAIRESIYQAGFFGLCFTVIYGIGNSWLITRFTSDSSVVKAIELIWPLIVWSQLINAMAFIVDGILFGAGAYKFLRNMMVFIFIFVFFPFAYLAHSNQSLVYLWAGLIMVSLARLVIGSFKVNKIH